ncbi:MAG: TonB-dependent receptor, partial [Gammaproteobacteria bacterium]|nr:TonB-dependent receptor [Gammaproteobacteria bacterium]
MGKRTRLFLFFLTCLYCTLVIGKETIVPAVIIKTHKEMTNGSLTNSPISFITDKQILLSGATSLTEVLQNSGEIQLQDMVGNGSQAALSMRGFGTNASSNSLLLINDIPITNPDLMPPNLNIIPIEQIKAIKIISGSESVLYGDQAVGGVVDLITQQKTREKAAISCRTGSYHQQECYVALYAHSLLDANITATKKHSDNYREHNHYDQQLLTGNLAQHYSRGDWRFDYTIAKEKMQYPGALTLAEVHQNRRQAANTTDFFTDQNNFFQLQHKQTWTPHWQSELAIASRRMDGNGVLYSPFKQSRQTFFIKPLIKGNWQDLLVTSGVDFQHDHYLLASTFGTTEDKQQKYSVFSIIDIPMSTQLLFSAGVRGALQETHAQSFSLSNTLNRAFASTAGFSYQLMPQMRFYLRRAESFRFPKADENADTLATVNGLRTQRGVAYESGISSQQENFSGKLGVFQLQLKDEIAFDPTQTPLAPFGTNRNLDRTTRTGFTLSGKKQITEKIAVDSQYNFVNARFQDGLNKGNRIPLVAENILRAGIHYQLATHWNVYSAAIYTGNNYAANDDANIAGKNGGYTIYNFNVRYDYHQFNASFHINNIFNKYYYYYTVYQDNQEFFYPAA